MHHVRNIGAVCSNNYICSDYFEPKLPTSPTNNFMQPTFTVPLKLTFISSLALRRIIDLSSSFSTAEKESLLSTIDNHYIEHVIYDVQSTIIKHANTLDPRVSNQSNSTALMNIRDAVGLLDQILKNS